MISNLEALENLTELQGLSENEKRLALQILQEFSASGSSQKYQELKYRDYKEIPVDIETFLTDDNYLGKAWKDATGKSKLYPFWLEQLKKLFPTNVDTDYNTFLESGARGLGKSEVACGCVCTYLMYRVMCMKNPNAFFKLKQTEKICFAFMNIKLALAEEIAASKFQKTVQMSPWFMSKGSMTTRSNQPWWVPPEPIQIIIGSQSDDVIGLPVFFCLDENTIIKTTEGDFKISSLEGKSIRVPSLDNNGNVLISEECTVKETAESLEEIVITLEDGSEIRCTSNHRFMLKDGTYKEAQYLTEEDELMELNN